MSTQQEFSLDEARASFREAEKKNYRGLMESFIPSGEGLSYINYHLPHYNGKGAWGEFFPLVAGGYPSLDIQALGWHLWDSLAHRLPANEFEKPSKSRKICDNRIRTLLEETGGEWPADCKFGDGVTTPLVTITSYNGRLEIIFERCNEGHQLTPCVFVQARWSTPTLMHAAGALEAYLNRNWGQDHQGRPQDYGTAPKLIGPFYSC